MKKERPTPGNRALGVLAAGAAMAVTLAACGGGSPSASRTAPTTNRAGSTGNRSSSKFPGATGEVAAITGSSMEVQNPESGQVTVSWTGSTVFTRTATVAESSVAVGDCVSATGSTTGGTLAATTVTISPPDSSGACNRPGALGRAPARFSRGGGSPPGSTPKRTLPAGAADFGFAGGKVTSVAPTSLVIFGFSLSGFAGRGRGSTGSTAPTSVPATTVTVDVNSSTRYSETQAASSADLAIDDCVTATGTADDTGAITARTIRITSMGPGGCTAGFGRGAFAGDGGPAANA